MDALDFFDSKNKLNADFGSGPVPTNKIAQSNLDDLLGFGNNNDYGTGTFNNKREDARIDKYEKFYNNKQRPATSIQPGMGTRQNDDLDDLLNGPSKYPTKQMASTAQGGFFGDSKRNDGDDLDKLLFGDNQNKFGSNAIIDDEDDALGGYDYLPSEKVDRRSTRNQPDNYSSSRRQNLYQPIEKKQDLSHISQVDNQGRSFGDEFNFSRDGDDGNQRQTVSRRDAQRPITGQNRRAESQDRGSVDNFGTNQRQTSRGDDFTENNTANVPSRRRVGGNTVQGTMNTSKPPMRNNDDYGNKGFDFNLEHAAIGSDPFSTQNNDRLDRKPNLNTFDDMLFTDDNNYMQQSDKKKPSNNQNYNDYNNKQSQQDEEQVYDNKQMRNLNDEKSKLQMELEYKTNSYETKIKYLEKEVENLKGDLSDNQDRNDKNNLLKNSHNKEILEMVQKQNDDMLARIRNDHQKEADS